MTDNLATFAHRFQMRHVRIYPHPIERVFHAVSTAGELDVWMLPFCEVDARLGGAWSMTFGDAKGSASTVRGMIIAFDPPRLVDYGGLRFELEEVANGTRLSFIESFEPGFVHPPGAGDGMPGADEPAPGTPWRPGFVAGWHGMMDDLADHLQGRARSQPMIDGKHAAYHGIHEPNEQRLIETYRRVIRDTIPPE